MSAETSPAPPPATGKRNNAWLWYFFFLVVASIGVAWLMIWYNLSIQLKPEQLEAARKLWKENGPRDYKLVLTQRVNEDAKPTTFTVRVKDGLVQDLLINGKPLEKDEEYLKLHYSMDRLFSYIEKFMDIDKKPGAPKVYATAIFDDKTGALRRYIRRVMGSRDRIEMNVTIEALSQKN